MINTTVNSNYTSENNAGKLAYTADVKQYLAKIVSKWGVTHALSNRVNIRPDYDKEFRSFKDISRIGVVNNPQTGQLVNISAKQSMRGTPHYDAIVADGWKDDKLAPEKAYFFNLTKGFEKFEDLGKLITSIESTFRK